jgi:signal transduction histidine kinase/ActR/RegA family two-component response regulator
MTIDNIEKAEDFVKNLKRSDNWVSNEELLTKLNDSYKIILENGREDLIPFVTVNIALYYIDLGEYGQAWEFTEIAKQKAEEFKNYDCLLNAISNQYRIQRYFGNLDTAQALVNKQIEIALEYNNDIQLFSAFLNQAYQYYLQNLKLECLDAFEKTISYSKKSKNMYSLSMVYITFSGHLIEYNELEKAEVNLSKGYDIALKNNFTNFIALANSNFGILYEKKNKYQKAIIYYKQSVELYNQLNNTNEENQVKIMFAETYLKAGKYQEAEKTLKDVQLFSEKNGIKSNLNSVYHLLSELYETQKEYKKSLQFYKKYKEQSEEIYNTETDKRIKNLEIIQRVNLLNIEKNTALSLASVKHDFLANMSHEIRTPINSILGICYLLQQQSLNTIQNNYVNRLQRSGENLLGIINDVLDISKIESGKMELVIQPFSLDTLLNDLHNSVEPKVIEKELKFSIYKKYNDDILLLGDAVRSYQVLLNLVSNAIKFTNTGGVKITVSVKKGNDNFINVIFHIQDTGIGIAKNKLDTIFERYEQADVTIKNKFGGTGLGLSISKKIVELMNGSIQIKSKLNKGTQFIVTVPFMIEKLQSIEKQTIYVDSNLLKNKIILIADDNEENRLVAKEILLSFNNSIKIMEASDGNEVIKLLFKKIPDILFIDLDMPNLNGIETTQQIRKNKKYDRIKIIGNTASLSTFTYEEFTVLGFDDFIYKPYKAENLIYKIQEVSK